MVPEQTDVADETIRFIYEVIDPFINNCWGLYAVDYNEDHEPYIYLVAGLINRGIRFLVSPDIIEHDEWIEKNWPADDPAYREEMERRFEQARQLAIRRGTNETRS